MTLLHGQNGAQIKETEKPGGGLWIAQWKTKEIINTILEG